MQCCGAPFGIGDRVEWSLLVGPDVGWLSVALGDELASRVTHAEAHHEIEDVECFAGRVRRAQAVRLRYGRVGDQPARQPIPGSSLLEDVDRVDGFEGDRGDVRLVGYLIDLDLDSDETR